MDLSEASGRDSRPSPGRRYRRLTLVGVLVGLFAALLAVKVLEAGGLEQTALFYVGVPAVLAVTVALTARPGTATGTAMVGVTIGLALAGPLLDEGVVCLVMAAPLFYLVAGLIGFAVDADRRDRGLAGIALLPLLAVVALTGAEAVPGAASRDTAADSVIVVEATPAEVRAALAVTPQFDRDLPPFLRLGFPRPVAASGAGLAVGDERAIEFTQRRSLALLPRPARDRTIELHVVESVPGRVVFDVVADTTLARWMDLRRSVVTWRPVGDGRTEVRWSLEYRRTFDPAWYFGPLQRYAAEEAAGHLLREVVVDSLERGVDR